MRRRSDTDARVRADFKKSAEPRGIAFAGLAACLILFAANAPALAQVIPPKQQFVIRLQNALRANDKNWLASHISYPARYFGRRRLLIRNKAWFVRNFRSVIDAKLRAAVVAQDPRSLFENWQGVMGGEGLHNIWIRDASGGDGSQPRYRIVTINDSP